MREDAAARVAATMFGTGFADAINRGEIPPHAALWVNRYISEIPGSWFEATDDFLRAAQEPGVFERSEGLLDELLIRIGQGGANLAEILEAEEAVTLHLTAATIFAARKLSAAFAAARVDAYPELADQAAIPGAFWSSDMDNQTCVCCEQIRKGVRPHWLKMFAVPGDWPDLAFRSVRLEIDRVASRLLQELRGEAG